MSAVATDETRPEPATPPPAIPAVPDAATLAALVTEAKALCVACAPEFSTTPIHIELSHSADGKWGPSNCGGFSLGKYRGGLGFVLNPNSLLTHGDDFRECFLASSLHEFVHAVLQSRSPLPEIDPVELVAQIRQSFEAQGAQPFEWDSYREHVHQSHYAHGGDFLRLLCHVHYRAQKQGEDFDQEILRGGQFPQAPLWEYAAALEGEPEAKTSERLLDILKQPPPAAFGSLWLADLELLDEFFGEKQGVERFMKWDAYLTSVKKRSRNGR